MSNKPPTINPIKNNEFAVLYPNELMAYLNGVNPGVKNAVNGRKIIKNNAPEKPNSTPILISFINIEISNHNGKLYSKNF
jgi:hypothetical protein